MSDEKFIVIPFKKAKKGGVAPGEMRQATTAVSAERIAGAMASRFAGVAAYAVKITEDGDMSEPRLITAHGEVADLTAA